MSTDTDTDTDTDTGEADEAPVAAVRGSGTGGARAFGYGELDAAGLLDTPLGWQVLDLLKTFDRQLHNDPSAVVETFSRLAVGMPLMPLLGGDDEWIDIFDDLQQNRRCPSVMRNKATGQAYDTMAYIFENPTTGSRLVTDRSRVAIGFPYYPRARIVQMTAPGAEAVEILPALPAAGEASCQP